MQDVEADEARSAALSVRGFSRTIFSILTLLPDSTDQISPSRVVDEPYYSVRNVVVKTLHGYHYGTQY